jgi:hypothetical protein
MGWAAGWTGGAAWEKPSFSLDAYVMPAVVRTAAPITVAATKDCLGMSLLSVSETPAEQPICDERT